jgi:hypothetical protein
MNTSLHPLRPSLAIAALALALSITACGDDGTSTSGGSTSAPDRSSSTTEKGGEAEPVIDPGDDGNYQPALTAEDVVPVIDNPYLPFLPGARWVYEGTTDEGVERTEVRVLDETRDIAGMKATVVRDTVSLEGEVIEDTYDWFVQDEEGNVWYLGEDVRNFEDGKVVDTDGSWETGLDGALPGIVMLADPQVGDAYRQEYWKGEAEDLGEVIELGATRSVPAGDFTDVLVTKDWNPLEPEVVEQKSYAPGVGLIFEEKVEGDEETVELVSYEPGRAP